MVHKSAMLSWVAGIRNQASPENNVQGQLHQQHRQEVDENRVYIKQGTLIFLA